MSTPKSTEQFQLGDVVRIRHYGINPGRIVELRGPLGPDGAQIYRVRAGRKPTRVYLEVRGDQLVLLRRKPSEDGQPAP